TKQRAVAGAIRSVGRGWKPKKAAEDYRSPKRKRDAGAGLENRRSWTAAALPMNLKIGSLITKHLHVFEVQGFNARILRGILCRFSADQHGMIDRFNHTRRGYSLDIDRVSAFFGDAAYEHLLVSLTHLAHLNHRTAPDRQRRQLRH